MPSTMIHLIAARKYKPKGSIEYFIGSLAPDAIADWRECDKKHLRGVENREQALSNLANSVDLDNDINLGMILHLYVDFIWDNGPLKRFIDDFDGDEWYKDYGYQNGRASSWLYNKLSWSKELWEDMLDFDFGGYTDDLDYLGDSVYELIERNYMWHEKTTYDSIGVFGEEMIDDITSNIANDFEIFMANLD